jgi:hypothetical protein
MSAVEMAGDMAPFYRVGEEGGDQARWVADGSGDSIPAVSKSKKGEAS